MGIDLDALNQEAFRDDGDCVVTRRWLRAVLEEIEASRKTIAAINSPEPALDIAPRARGIFR